MNQIIKPNATDLDFNFWTKGQLEKDLDILLNLLPKNESEILTQDFKTFLEKGRFIVQNTFAGGILYLKEPEGIDYVKVIFNTEINQAIAIVEYSSKHRNPTNTKYKPFAGKIESIPWNPSLIFPHFIEYSKEVQETLLLALGKMVKTICEYHYINSEFMKYKSDFDFQMVLDDDILHTYKVETQVIEK